MANKRHISMWVAAGTLTLPLSLAALTGAIAQESMGSATAQAALEKGEAAFKQKQYDLAVEAFKQAITLDPAYVQAHERFINVSRIYVGRDDQRAAIAGLERIYQSWIAAGPKQAAYVWGLGYINYSTNPTKCEQYSRKAVQLDPKFARAWYTLSQLSELRGNQGVAADNLRRAVEANSRDPSYLFNYSRLVTRRDPSAGTKLALDLVEKFPASDYAALSLYWLGVDELDTARRIAYLERLRKDYPPAKFSVTASGMTALVEAYASTAPDKAVALARDMAAADPENKTLAGTLALQEAFAKTRLLIAEKKSAEALAVLQPIKPPRFGVAATLFTALMAEAEATSGDIQKAYSRMLASVTTEPADAMVTVLQKYGASLGKTSAAIDDELWGVRDKQAKPATPFSLRTFEGRTVSLSDYKGRVFLFNLWFPNCGPCRKEFPFLQNVLNKFKSRGFEVVAVNIRPEEDEFVVPFMKGNGYGFLTLRAPREWIDQNFRGIIAPQNFLIDADGRVMFRPTVQSPDGQRTLENEIEALLRRIPAK